MTALRFRFHTFDFDGHDIHLRTLKDKQQFLDEDGIAEMLHINSASWSHFGTVWASAQVLAHLLADYAVDGKRILAIGCGIALPSMVLNHRHADISATDYHPQVQAFLDYNTRLNGEKTITFFLSDWHEDDSDLGTFDLLIGSDILYEEDHIELLSDFINRHARQSCEVILVDPGRRHHARFSKKMQTWGFTCSQSKPLHTDYLEQPFKGRVLRYCRGQ